MTKCNRCGKENVDPVYPHTCTPPLAIALAETLERQFPEGTAHSFLDGEAAAELRRLHNVKLAFDEWIDKTAWVQHTAGARDLGKHRADVLRERIERLEAENEALREALKAMVQTSDEEVLLRHDDQREAMKQAQAALARAGEVK